MHYTKSLKKWPVLPTPTKRLCAIKVKVNDFQFILFNVYMPVDPGYGNHEIIEYKSVLQEMSVIMFNSDTQYFILGGDWNSEIVRNNVQTNNFLSFIEDESLFLGLNFKDANVPYTFHNALSNSTIDHFLVTSNLSSYIKSYETIVDIDFNIDDFSDHVPLKLELNIEVSLYDESPRSFLPSTA